MAFTGSIRDTETARLASQTILLAEELGLLVDGDLTSLSAAQAAVTAGEAALAVPDRIYATQVNRALELADNFGADLTASSLATLYAGLPDNYGKTARLRM